MALPPVLILAIYPSALPPKNVECRLPGVAGKLALSVPPLTYTLFWSSIKILYPASAPTPPRYDDQSMEVRLPFILNTTASSPPPEVCWNEPKVTGKLPDRDDDTA